MFDLNKLIGIPFKLNRRDFSGCDCRGICWLYYKYVKNIEMPFSDGKRIIFRNKNNDIQRMVEGLKDFGKQISFNELKEGDVMLIKNTGSIGALGICINNRQVLHMDLAVGSCLTPLRYLKELFFMGFRPNV